MDWEVSEDWTDSFALLHLSIEISLILKLHHDDFLVHFTKHIQCELSLRKLLLSFDVHQSSFVVDPKLDLLDGGFLGKVELCLDDPSDVHDPGSNILLDLFDEV